MTADSSPPPLVRTFEATSLPGAARYRLLTSLVVPRPIGWISTRGVDGVRNLAPFSYFAALSSTPMQVGVSVGHRSRSDGTRAPKDTLANLRARGAFCVNVVTEDLLEAMNATSAEVGPGVDEFEFAGLEGGESEVVDAPFVAGCPAVLECRVAQEVALGEAPNTLVVGEVVGLRLAQGLVAEGEWAVDPHALRPVGRLQGAAYGLLGEIRIVPRP